MICSITTHLPATACHSTIRSSLRDDNMLGERIAPDDEDDRAQVELLQARLEKTVLLTKKIRTSQSRLETSGSSVQQAIGPIYNNTQRLQVLTKSDSISP